MVLLLIYTYIQFGCSAPGPLMYINMIFVIFTEHQHTTYTNTRNKKLKIRTTKHPNAIQDVENA